MSKHQGFLLHFVLGQAVMGVLLLGFVTWMDPFRNLNMPWRIDFISDRNPGYKRFKLLGSASGVTDLVVGSSTSEVFVPQVLKEKYGVNAFASNTGGASLPLRLLMIRHALATQPGLKRIIYVADLFELSNPVLDSAAYYQPEMMKEMDDDLVAASGPEWTQRFSDFFSFLVIDRSIRTFKDFIALRRGVYVSSYHADGSTTQSMIGGRQGDLLERRVMASAAGLRAIYGEMTEPHPHAIRILGRLTELMEAHPGVELHLILAPFHELFYRQFSSHFERTKIYSKWVEIIQSCRRPNVFVHDFSYPAYLSSGVLLDDRFWQDGVHFTSELMLKMAERIYTEPTQSAEIGSVRH